MPARMPTITTTIISSMSVTPRMRLSSFMSLPSAQTLLDSVLRPQGPHRVVREAGLEAFRPDAEDRRTGAVGSLAVRIGRSREQHDGRRCDAALGDLDVRRLVDVDLGIQVVDGEVTVDD